MPFRVVPPGRPPAGHKGFILRRDNWNDYSFQTQYQLFFGDSEGEPEFIGDVKILRRGQTAADTLQIEIGSFEVLSNEFCSVGQSLDYYERLAALGLERRNEALDGLRDIVQHSNMIPEFENEKGWTISLFRNFAPDADFLVIAKSLIDRNFEALPSEELSFSFHADGWETPLVLNFSSPASALDNRRWSFGRKSDVKLPARIAVLIGRNGSGKSTLLARLARIAHASPSDRETPQLKKLGVLTPRGIGFTRIVAISYSAFDSFLAPGVNSTERRQVAQDIQTGKGRYMFCGLRDIGRELAELAELGTHGAQIEQPERLPLNRIKSLENLSDEFAAAIDRIETLERVSILQRCTKPLFLDPSLYGGEETDVISFLAGNPRDKFQALSTGHKIALHVVTSIVSHVERKSIVLFDEPETHLHPPLLAALMHSLRLALYELDAFAIVATHSPVVVQETLGRQVQKVVREGDVGRIFPPEIETFGESIGAITNEVFALDAQTTDYHVILRELASAYGALDPIEELFENGLSAQARAFVLSILASRDAKER